MPGRKSPAVFRIPPDERILIQNEFLEVRGPFTDSDEIGPELARLVQAASPELESDHGLAKPLKEFHNPRLFHVLVREVHVAESEIHGLHVRVLLSLGHESGEVVPVTLIREHGTERPSIKARCGQYPPKGTHFLNRFQLRNRQERKQFLQDLEKDQNNELKRI